MKQTRIIMDMPITVEIADKKATAAAINQVFRYFHYVDNTFSTFKPNSEISRINSGLMEKNDYSFDMNTVLSLSEQTKIDTNGYFNISRAGFLDPSGLVKGWAIRNAAELLKKNGFTNYYVDAGGDIQLNGNNGYGTKWTVGIRNPFNRKEIVKVILMDYGGIATSGTAIRGQHIYNPFHEHDFITDIVSLTVIGPDIYEADRYATACFAMGKSGIEFIENLPGFEGYMINKNGIATFTSGFNAYVQTYDEIN